MKIIFIVLLFSLSVFASTVTINTTGIYTQQTFSGPSPIANETQYARVIL